MAKALSLFLLFSLLLSFHAAGEDLLSRRLSISLREIPIKQALNEISTLAGFEWSYNAKILDTDRRVTLNVRDWTVRETLREILGDGYTFKSSGKYLILKKQKPPKSSLSGVIRDPNTGERLANVTVYDRKTLRATKTDSSGFYSLKVKKQTEVSIVRLGYQDTTFRVSSQTARYQTMTLTPVPIPVPDTSASPHYLKKSFQKAATELDYFFAATRDKWHDLNFPDTLHRRFQISLLPMIGTNHVLSGKVKNDWSVNLLAGQSAGVGQVEVAGLGNFTKNQVSGFQAAGLFNLNRGNCSGVQAAGLYNQTADTLKGIQLAGMVNVARYSPRLSLQASGLLNIIRKNDNSDTSASLPQCVQLAGFANKANAMEGVQAAGFINTAQGVEGVQAAGFINVAKEVKGVQVAGFINKARRVRGVQISIINSADDLKGFQIGLINRSGKRWLPIFNW
ncbi:MAG: carboxypeptidase-like regulatory domain-containing protein [Lewinellaceae bacterium]|nr:carboxypeptidase-like regulatory domain-containing protein [Lewinellaceae bacterium]